MGCCWHRPTLAPLTNPWPWQQDLYDTRAPPCMPAPFIWPNMPGKPPPPAAAPIPPPNICTHPGQGERAAHAQQCWPTPRRQPSAKHPVVQGLQPPAEGLKGQQERPADGGCGSTSAKMSSGRLYWKPPAPPPWASAARPSSPYWSYTCFFLASDSTSYACTKPRCACMISSRAQEWAAVRFGWLGCAAGARVRAHPGHLLEARLGGFLVVGVPVLRIRPSQARRNTDAQQHKVWHALGAT